MPRPPRMLLSDRPTVYHVMSRTALPGLPFDGIDKDDFLACLKTLSQVYFTEILEEKVPGELCFCTMKRLARD